MFNLTILKPDNIAMRYGVLFLMLMCNITMVNAFDHKHVENFDLIIESSWARALPPVVPNGAAYLTITNNGQQDTLLKVSSSIAANSMVHESYTTDNQIAMRHINKVVIGKGQHVEFKPGGYHIMLMGLKQPLSLDTQFTLTLTFENAGEVNINVPVVKDKASLNITHSH